VLAACHMGCKGLPQEKGCYVTGLQVVARGGGARAVRRGCAGGCQGCQGLSQEKAYKNGLQVNAMGTGGGRGERSSEARMHRGCHR
jgi:hypothetical protein